MLADMRGHIANALSLLKLTQWRTIEIGYGLFRFCSIAEKFVTADFRVFQQNRPQAAC